MPSVPRIRQYSEKDANDNAGCILKAIVVNPVAQLPASAGKVMGRRDIACVGVFKTIHSGTMLQIAFLEIAVLWC